MVKVGPATEVHKPDPHGFLSVPPAMIVPHIAT